MHTHTHSDSTLVNTSTCTHTHILSTPPISLSLSHAHTHVLSTPPISLSLSHAHTSILSTPPISLSLSLSHMHTHMSIIPKRHSPQTLTIKTPTLLVTTYIDDYIIIHKYLHRLPSGHNGGRSTTYLLLGLFTSILSFLKLRNPIYCVYKQLRRGLIY